MTAQPEVRENVAEHRFEIWLGDVPAGHLTYQGLGPTLSFMHTEIDEQFGGRGLGSILIREALETVRARGGQVLPYCPFVKSYLQKHPDYLNMVPAGQRSRFGLPEEATA